MGQGLRSRVPGPPPISIPGSCISHPRSVFLQWAETVDTLPFWACAAPCTDTQEDGDTPTRMTEMLSLDFYPDSRPHINKLKYLPSNVLSANSQAMMSYLQVAPHQSSCVKGEQGLTLTSACQTASFFRGSLQRMPLPGDPPWYRVSAAP